MQRLRVRDLYRTYLRINEPYVAQETRDEKRKVHVWESHSRSRSPKYSDSRSGHYERTPPQRYERSPPNRTSHGEAFHQHTELLLDDAKVRLDTQRATVM